ncbi:MAG TPA: diacylglycerol kinase family protein [Candidatus Paceibacterota bacterium]|nr:diacylglycerol kinase family protein [Candidatus Paceibacterota bacterium]
MMKILRKKWQNAQVSYRALYVLLQEGLSFRAHVVTAVVVVFFSFVFAISKTELLIVLLVIATVLSIEALNTAIEEICNHVTPEYHPQIGKIKDLSSGASGIIGIAAVIIGLMIFIPRLGLFL